MLIINGLQINLLFFATGDLFKAMTIKKYFIMKVKKYINVSYSSYSISNFLKHTNYHNPLIW